MGDRARYIHLVGMSVDWGWKGQGREALWAAADAPSPDWALQALYHGYATEKNTTEMLRVARRMVAYRASDLKAKNNVAVFSILLQQDVHDALVSARDLVKEKPDDPVFRSTLAFALLANGMTEESLEAIEQLQPEQRTDPAYAPYFAMVYQANGDVAKAREFLAKVDRKGLLPEEVALVDRVGELVGP
jgi:predicted Zn-dependent protease